MENNVGALDWNDTIENDDNAYVVLPEGEYRFTVAGMERDRFPGSARLPACNKAALTLEVEGPEGPVTVKTDLILHRTLEWKLAAFVRSIGLKKRGTSMVMDWKSVYGAEGRALFRPRTYQKDGSERQVNDVARFLDPLEDDALPWEREGC